MSRIVMKRKFSLKILSGIVALLALLTFLAVIIAESRIEKKILSVLNKNNKGLIITAEKVNVSIFSSSIELENIAISSKNAQGDTVRNLSGSIASIRASGFNRMKLLFRKELDIHEVTITNSHFDGRIPFPEKPTPPVISDLNVRIETILVDQLDLAIQNTKNNKGFSLKKGNLKLYKLQINKLDTLSPAIISQFDFAAEELSAVSSDSLYSYLAQGVRYLVTSNTLAVEKFSIHPNYTGYEFTGRHKFQTDRIEAGFSSILVHNLSAADYFNSGNLVSAGIEIGELDMKIFRDQRKKFRHVNKPVFQEILYNYPGYLRIDSIGIASGNIRYSVHAAKASGPGEISFTDISAQIYNITNDTLYKKEKGTLELHAEALVMEKGRISVLLKAGLFDKNNTFRVQGNLSGFDAKELNPIVEKTAFMHINSGTLEAMNFSFTADNAKAAGRMTMLYHGLDIAVINKQTNDTTAIKEIIVSMIANNKIMDSNPARGKAVREGMIDFERDPERFVFHYCFKSILTGIQSSMMKNSKKKENRKNRRK